MAIIRLRTLIKAPVEVCFDLARSIDLHQLSMERFNEAVIAGRTTGLIEEGETVTWRARHFGVYLKMKVEIITMSRPYYFQDSMVEGPFSSMRHDHHFCSTNKLTHMHDIFWYEVPFGTVGKLADELFLRAYMTRLLMLRNSVIKKLAEGDPHNLIDV